MTEYNRPAAEIPPKRRIYANRTLNLRSIGAIGYDMDYTLVHYHVETWERRAYDAIKRMLADDGWPVAELDFDPTMVARGLVIDTELGNVVKANRFGYVMRAAHGTRLLDFDEQRAVYRHTPVDLSESRFYFLNTPFSLSGSCLFCQLVDLYDQRRLPEVHGYGDLFRRVDASLDQTHVEGSLKTEIVAEPGRYIGRDPDLALALLDQQRSGKRLMLITNAQWPYVRDIMAYTLDGELPDGVAWRDLFELVIVEAKKPHFFSQELPLFTVVDEDRNLMAPVPGRIPGPGVYLGGDASRVEEYLGLSGAEILFVGDHIHADVQMSKKLLRWRTALVVREIERELAALDEFRPTELRLAELMNEKEHRENDMCQARLELQRLRLAYGPVPSATEEQLERLLESLWSSIEELDGKVAPLARGAAEIVDPRWGPLLRAGNDKSHLARQIERSADIYTSRVSNFLYATPFAYLRSTRGTMPHDP